MDKEIAKSIGRRLAIKSGLIGIFIGYTIFGGLLYLFGGDMVKSIFWIKEVEYGYHVVVGALGLLIMSYFFGQLAGVDILVKRKDEQWTGIKYGLIVLITGTLIGSSVGFIEEGLDNIGTNDDPFYDYYFKPLYWVTIFGGIPVIVVGQWFGRQIKKQGLKERIV